MSIIEVKDLTRDYGNGKGVFNVSFALDQGEVFGFLGPNGAGKTTTIRHLMGASSNRKTEAALLKILIAGAKVKIFKRGSGIYPEKSVSSMI